MPFQVHQEPLYKRYYSPWFSAATLYSLFFVFVLIILPLIIAYNSYDFWLKDDIYLEQPDVTYKYLANFQWHGHDSSGQPHTWSYSTNAQLNTLLSNLRAPLVRSAELDDNRDGVVDRLEMSVLLPLGAGEAINAFDAVLYHDVQLSQKAKLLFDAMAFVSFEAGTGMQALEVDGDLMLKQAWPLNVYGGYQRLYEDDPLFDVSTTSSAQDVAMQRLLRRYTARNVTMVFRPTYSYVTRRAPAPNTDNGASSFNVSLTMRVPTQYLTYTPPTSAVLKFAWIQYMSFFLVVAFVLFSLNSFIYRHQLIPTHVVADMAHPKSR